MRDGSTASLVLTTRLFGLRRKVSQMRLNRNPSAVRTHAGLTAIVGTLALFLGGFAATPALADTPSSCPTPELSQPFLPNRDSNWYMQVPGQNGNDFNAAGWTLSGGASVLNTTQADGQSAGVLDLPSGSKAVSPTICISSNYPVARMMVRNVVGAEGVFFYVSYANTPTWNSPKNTGQVHGKGTAATLSDPVNLQPSNLAGAQWVRFTLVPGGKSSDFQVYEFYVDPFCRH
jgi:hypothetical protein